MNHPRSWSSWGSVSRSGARLGHVIRYITPAVGARWPQRPNARSLRCGGIDITLRQASDEFLATRLVANPNTHRAYASAVDRTIAALGGGKRLLAEVGDNEIGDALATLWS